MAYKDRIKDKEYRKAYYEAHKEECIAKSKAYYQENKEEYKAYQKAHKEELKEYNKAWVKEHREELNALQKEYNKADLNSLSQTKQSIRCKSYYYLKKYGTIIKGYEIHHSCTYTEPYKFIYCSRELHRTIHSYLKAHNIDADSEHYEQIKHLLDDSVVKYNIE